MLLSESTAAITDLFITTAQTAVLTSILAPPVRGDVVDGLYNKNSHLRTYSAKDHAGKYQNALLSANAICKYVTGFSFGLLAAKIYHPRACQK